MSAFASRVKHSVRVDDLVRQMRAVCERYGVEYVVADSDSIAGVADNVESGVWPLNGLRHGAGSTSGWFLWAGAELSTAPDFFKPVHVAHLVERCPELLPYLGLAPGSRFLIAPGHEDVWTDAQLLEEDV